MTCPNGNNTSGRQSNRGMEGLAITPDGKKLYGLMQSPLIQDGALSASNARRGIYNRLLERDLATGATRELVYPMESNRADGTTTLGTNEILAVNDVQFLVIERDGDAGANARVKKICLIDISLATDAKDVQLPQTGALPVGAVPVTKTLPAFLDLLDPAFGLAGDSFPEKIEGLAWGPHLPDGRRLLLVTSDNDFFATQPTRIYAFAVDAALVPGGGLKLNNKGRTSVAILSAGLLDATAIDPSSVRVGGAPATLKGNDRPQCAVEDANGDGVADLVCHVEAEQIVPQAGRVAPEAFTDSGTPVRQWLPLR